jgi:2-polyprenyl-3-methyl-5-hydroxy-6-metoxy-1,4-benzoquinol methylase
LDFTTRSYEKELLDKEHIPFADVLTTMQELNVINTYLGGHAITLRGVNYFLDKLPAGQELLIAEIGSGGGDNLTVIDKYLKKKKRPYALIGIDMKPGCIHYAEQEAAEGITWICSDYRKVEWPGRKPDIIFSSLFCHHFTDEQLIEQLHWLRNNTTTGFFINDLQRHPVAYYSIKVLTAMFSNSYLVKNDGPLSVRRAFKKEDWERLLGKAGITRHSIQWQWAFRYLICAENGQQQ